MILTKYFQNISDIQFQQFEQLEPLYQDWNNKINVISRKDIDNLYLHHVLHSLAIAKFINFKSNSNILDLGTGGGFPGIPLAIFFPEVQFTLVDGTGKKIRVVQEIIDALALQNVTARHLRAEEIRQERFDFVISRAVAELGQLITWSFPLLKKKQQNAIPNGLIALKGGNVKEEIKNLPRKEYIEQQSIAKFFKEPYFEDKFVIYVQG